MQVKLLSISRNTTLTINITGYTIFWNLWIITFLISKLSLLLWWIYFLSKFGWLVVILGLIAVANMKISLILRKISMGTLQRYCKGTLGQRGGGKHLEEPFLEHQNHLWGIYEARKAAQNLKNTRFSWKNLRTKSKISSKSFVKTFNFSWILVKTFHFEEGKSLSK